MEKSNRQEQNEIKSNLNKLESSIDKRIRVLKEEILMKVRKWRERDQRERPNSNADW